MIRLGCTFALVTFAWVSLVAQAPSLRISLNFTSTTQEDSHTRAEAPDVDGAVGPNHVVEFINGDFKAYEKRTGKLVLAETSDAFWDKALGTTYGPNPDNKDPRIVYDARAQRWYASAQRPARGDTSLVVARSDTADPTAGWKGVAFYVDAKRTPDTFGDFDQLGFNADAILISINQFGIKDGKPVPDGLALFSIKKQDLNQPAPVLTLDRKEHLTDTRTVSPAIDHDGTGHVATYWGLGPNSAERTSANDLFVRSDTAGDLAMWNLTRTATVVGDKPGQSLQKTLFPPLTVSQPDGEPSQTQGKQPAVVHLVNGEFWLVHTVRHADDAKRTALRWWRIRATDNAILDEGILSDPTLSFIQPSIAVDRAGHVVIASHGTSATQYLSAYALVGRTTGGKVVFNQAPTLLKAGEGVHGPKNSRWGDYSTTVADPSAPGTFWTFLAYAQKNGKWATEITQLTFTGPTK
jgi:hypothetical protein